MKDEWLKFKKYPHIGKPLTARKDKARIKAYVIKKTNIKKHKFVPLLHRTLTQRKFRPIENAPKNPSGKRQRTKLDKKVRHIFYPCHLDSIIYSRYNYLLTEAYEKYLKDKDFGVAAVAYRKIPIVQGEKPNKSNIEFAFEAFNFIEKNKDKNLSIIVADITSFFDNLDLRILHKQWKRVLNEKDLPDDHYAIYKSLVDYKYVNEKDLFERFKSKLIVERFKPNDTSEKEYKRKSVKNVQNLRRENVVAFCYNDEFFDEA